MLSLVKIDPVVLEKKIFFNFVNLFLLFRNYLPLEKGGVLHLNKFDSPSTKDALCQVWLKLVQWFLRRIFYLISSMFFAISLLSPLGKGMVLHLNKSDIPSTTDALYQVWLILVQWFLRRRCLNIVNVFLLFRNSLPLEKNWALHLNKLESPLLKNSWCQF